MKMIKTSLLMISGIILCLSCTKTMVKTNPDNATVVVISPADSIATDSLDRKISLSPKKYIYLTIDDAPLNGSRYIDSVIAATQVKTSIFMVGNPIHGSGRFKKYHEMLKENRHIELYNHSYSHANHKYAR
ncbi:polysaccharide deacetylase family protein, partial [Bacteroides sp. OttesenSCG-928-D19]|nr:polysaccharide deacetylase family protein [Bacteroides sp. OttesenSCG-928-D19]